MQAQLQNAVAVAAVVGAILMLSLSLVAPRSLVMSPEPPTYAQAS